MEVAERMGVMSSLIAILPIIISIHYIGIALDLAPCAQGRCWPTLTLAQLTILAIFLVAIGIRSYNLIRHAVNSVLNPTARSTVLSSDKECSSTFSEALDLICRIGGILLVFYICDKTTLIPRAEKNYDRSHFIFLLVLILLAGLASVRRCSGAKASDEILGREQTEEWKGWMQVLAYYPLRSSDTPVSVA
jgi:hypothetical protein